MKLYDQWGTFMLWLNRKKEQIRKIIIDFKQIKTVSEFLDYFSIELLSRIAIIFVMVWSLVPILLMILSIFYDRSSVFSFMFNSSRLTIIWYMLMQQIGYLGFLMVILLIFKSLKDRKVNQVPIKTYMMSHSVEILLIIFLGWSLITTFFSNNISQSLTGSDYRKDGWLSYLAYGGFYGLGYLLIKSKYLMNYLNSLVIVSLVLGLLLIINEPSINEILTFYNQSTVFYNPNHFGYYLVIAILSAACLAMRNPKINRYQFLYYIAYSILVIALIKNGSFGPYLAVCGGLLFLLVLTLLMKKSRLMQAVSISFLFLGITLMMNAETNFLSNEVSHLAIGINDIIDDNEEAPSAGSGRWSLWTNGLEFMIEKPLVGYGIENLEQAYLTEGILQDRPHNEFIQIGASIGIIGLMIYISALGFHFLELIKDRKYMSFLTITLFMIVFGYLISTFFGNSMFYTTPYFMIIFGISRQFLELDKSLM